MNITELDSYNLADAVKFHNRLNPRIWGPDEHLLPEVRSKLLEIAADFQEFLGLSDLDVKDITLSGSNAAYSYTPHSDIDLHLVVDVPKDEVYQELFNAKKYQYNDIHNIKVRGADVELYVQPADEAPVSLGEYSIVNNEWIEIPKRKRAKIDQSLVRHKYEDLKARIESALKEDDSQRIQALIDKIKNLRQTGLDQHGEFGPENLAFKMLRSQGWIKKLYEHVAAARDRELSLKEQEPKKPIRYGFGSAKPADASDYRALFKPAAPKAPAPQDMRFNHPQDYEWWQRQQAKKKELAAEDAGETWDGVNPTTCMVVNEEEHDNEQIVHQFIEWAADKLGIDQLPEIFIHADPKWSVEEHSFGRYEPESHSLHVNMANRHLFDILRTTAHELAHCKQNQAHPLPDDAGNTGSEWENEAHAAAGIIMREFADAHPELFATPALQESASGYIPTKKQAKDPRYSMALTVDIKPGQVGKEANKMALDTDSQGKPAMVYQSVNKISESLDKPELTIPELAKKHGVSTDAIKQQLAKGIKVELEHTSSKATAREIALDHLAEFPDYYDRLAKAETNESLFRELAEEFALLEEEYLGEIKMSPSNLRQEAAKTGAQAGMEFEMIVPNVGAVDEDPEPDYDYDESVIGIRDAVNFFDDGDYNGRREIQRLEESMRQDYEEWVFEHFDEYWADNAPELIREYLTLNASDSEIAEILELDDEETEELENNGSSKAEYTAAAEKVLDERDSSSWYDSSRDAAQEDYLSDSDREEEWLHSEGIKTMMDVMERYDITWPHWTSGDSGDINVNDVAEDFSNAIGKPINASTSYHGARREPGHYVVEPDGSLEGDDDDDAGLEFVSPPMPIDEMMSDLNKVKAWADARGCYTNKSTGLHINISVPNFSIEKLDYVKLALLLGDKYVLDQYGRASNTYTKSAIGKVQDKVKAQPETAKAMLDKMRGGLDQLASKAIHSGTTDKYTSINTKSGYIEFRSPGGDWLNENFDKIENTLLRFTVALSAAMDPEAYRQEYLKKLYKLLEPTAVETKNPDTIKYFADYVAGKTPKAALRSFVKQAQLQRKIAKDPTGGQKYWWEVTNPANSFASIEVVASSKEEAIAAAVEPGNYPEWARARNTLQAKPIRPYDSSPVKATVGAPQAIGQSGGPTVGGRPSNPEGNYVITPEDDRSSVYYRFNAAGFDDANVVRRQWVQDHPERVWVVQRDDNRTLGQPPVPGSTIDLQRQRAAQAQSTGTSSTGEWGLWAVGPQRFSRLSMNDNAPVRRFDTEEQGRAWLAAQRGLDPDRFDIRRIPANYSSQPAQQSSAPQSSRSAQGNLTPTGPGPWEIYRISDGSTVRELSNTNRGAAESEARMALGFRAEAPELYGVRTRQAAAPAQQQQPAPQPLGAGREFAGWRVLLPSGEEVYRFSGVGNSQADANRVAADWLRNNGMGVAGEGFEVVPLWREA